MVIVVRKVLLVNIFLLFDTLAAVWLAIAVTLCSLCIHVAARPFEDVGTDWTEMLALVAEVLLLING